MGLEIFCQFLFKSSDGIFERAKKISLDGEQAGFTNPYKFLCEDAKNCPTQ